MFQVLSPISISWYDRVGRFSLQTTMTNFKSSYIRHHHITLGLYFKGQEIVKLEKQLRRDLQEIYN